MFLVNIFDALRKEFRQAAVPFGEPQCSAQALRFSGAELECANEAFASKTRRRYGNIKLGHFDRRKSPSIFRKQNSHRYRKADRQAALGCVPLRGRGIDRIVPGLETWWAGQGRVVRWAVGSDFPAAWPLQQAGQTIRNRHSDKLKALSEIKQRGTWIHPWKLALRMPAADLLSRIRRSR